MISIPEVRNLLSHGGTVVDSDGSKIGKIGQVFLDDETGQPEWVTVRTGLFGTGESFVPLEQAEVHDTEVRVPYSKDKVKDAPRIGDSDSHLSPEEENVLYEYYAKAYGAGGSAQGMKSTTGRVQDGDVRDGDVRDGGVRDTGVRDTDRDAGGRHLADRSGEAGTVGHDTSGPTTDSAMTRSEERLSVGTEKVPVGRVRLRKYVVTENVTQTVPVSHEEVRLEREPVTDANRDAALSGPDLTDEEHEVVLEGERVVTDKETVPVERVRLDTETVTEEQQVQEQVAKEQIDLDDAEVRESAQRRDR